VKANALITSDVDDDKDEASRFFFKFTDIRVGLPVVKEDCVTH
jgi:hypothetical protein